MASGCLTRKIRKRCLAVFARCLAVFVDFFHFLLLFLLVVSFDSYFLLVKGVRFVTFFTTCNFHVLLFTGPGGPGFVGYSLCDGGLGCTLIFFPFFFFYY